MRIGFGRAVGICVCKEEGAVIVDLSDQAFQQEPVGLGKDGGYHVGEGGCYVRRQGVRGRFRSGYKEMSRG